MCDFVKNESSRCLHCKNPQCTTGCPVGYDIPLFLSLAKEGRIDDAVNVVGHLFGEICGYVCPRDKQCKGHCILGKRGASVDVGRVERAVFEKSFPRVVSVDDSLSHLKVAVVGGGVSGVTFAVQCHSHGADVTLYERTQLLHTLKSIPDFRLPRAAVQRVVTAVENSSINVVQKDVDAVFLRQLCENSDVVYLATGVSVPNPMYVQGEELALCADDFLRGSFCGKTVVVGGGNTAMDCARLNARRGFETVVAYRRTRQDMPAFDLEVESAQSENVTFCYNLAPVRVQKVKDKLVATFAKTVSEGRGKLTVTDQLVEISCDNIVVATGSKFDNKIYGTEKFLTVDGDNCVRGNLFAGGDAAGKSLVAEAVFDALHCARAVVKKYSKQI